MPSSFHCHLSKMVDWITRVQPKSVLDIGVGHGKWGFLAREYTDIFYNRYKRETWETQIIGVEAFPDYATPVYDYAYNEVRYGDLLDLMPTLPDVDLVIIGDVIEHFTKEQGQHVLAEIRKKAGYILLSSPTVFFQQEVLGNPWETHKSLWTVADFAGWEFEYDEFEHCLFVALLKGDKKISGQHDVKLNGRASSFVYSRPWLKRRPKLAQLVKARMSR